MPIRRSSPLGLTLLVLAGAGLAGCTTGGNSTDLASGPQVIPAGEITTILSGKSWRFTGPNNTGTTLYAADGTSLVEVTGKGKTKGAWRTEDGKLCESFEPAPFLPGGVPMSCYSFSRGTAPNTYQVGKATFTLAG